MNPRLVAFSGPLKGNVFPLREDETTLGRSNTNMIAIPDRAVSRQHCVIRREDGEFKLIDSESHNGCFVNAVPVKEHPLREGDRLEIGESSFLFQTATEESGASGTVEIRDDVAVSGQTVFLRREDTIYLQPEQLAATEPTPQHAQNLRFLLRVSQAINSGGPVDALAVRLLSLIMEFVSADRGAVLLEPRLDGQFGGRVGWDRRAGASTAVHVSRTMVRAALDDGRGRWYQDRSGDAQVCDSEGSVAASLSSDVLAVPITSSRGTIGVIYLTKDSPAQHFQRTDLELTTAIASLSGTAFENALALKRLELENTRLQNEIERNYKMVGRSPAMEKVYWLIDRLARQNSTVLITGESGTGKELVARALHGNSPRAGKPFAAVNCAAFVDTLFESEIFGHEKGAYTDAVAMRRGKLETTEGGTLFLDEIGELTPRLQPKLLRVLQEHEFERVGGSRVLKSDVRLIVATNRDLEDEIVRGNFREDLFFRLNVVRIHVPPLRERREDILPLANYFVEKHCRKAKRRLMTISPETQKCLQAHHWPGNVRELDNAIEHAVVLAAEDVIRPDSLPDAVADADPASGGRTRFHETIRQAKRDMLVKALDKTGGSVVDAAELLGLHVNSMHRLLRTLGIRPGVKQADEHSGRNRRAVPAPRMPPAH